MATASLSLFILQNVTPDVAPAVAHVLERIAFTQTMIAIALTVIALLFLGAGAVGIVTLRRLNVVLRALEVSVAALKPRAEPILDAMHVASRDAAGLVGAIRGRVDALMRTVDELHAQIRNTADDAKIRVQQFGAVLDIVQEEAEGLLLDAAATARGVHTTAELLRDPDVLLPPGTPLVTAEVVVREPPATVPAAEVLGGTTISKPLDMP